MHVSKHLKRFFCVYMVYGQKSKHSLILALSTSVGYDSECAPPLFSLCHNGKAPSADRRHRSPEEGWWGGCILEEDAWYQDARLMLFGCPGLEIGQSSPTYLPTHLQYLTIFCPQLASSSLQQCACVRCGLVVWV